MPWRREKWPTPVFWPGEFHGQYSPWVCKRVGHDWATFKLKKKKSNSSYCLEESYWRGGDNRRQGSFGAMVGITYHRRCHLSLVMRKTRDGVAQSKENTKGPKWRSLSVFKKMKENRIVRKLWMVVLVTQLWPHGVLPARLLSPWNSPGKNTGSGLPFPSSGIEPRDWTQVSHIAGRFFTIHEGWGECKRRTAVRSGKSSWAK